MTKIDQIIYIIENQIREFVDSIKPPVDIRNKVDIGYTFQNNVLQIFEIRPRWDIKDELINLCEKYFRFYQ